MPPTFILPQDWEVIHYQFFEPEQIYQYYLDIIKSNNILQGSHQ
jgi:hypothetical protein